MRLVLLGPPGAGKGSLATKLSENMGLPHISTGDIFRQNIKSKSTLGIEAERFIKSGTLVPDDITNSMISVRLMHDDCQHGFILDGFPRNLDQAFALNAILEEMDTYIDIAFELCSDLNIIIQRLTSRQICEKCGRIYNTNTLKPQHSIVCDDCGGKIIQRSDDNLPTIINRYKDYIVHSKDIKEYYSQRGILKSVDGNKTIDDTVSSVINILNKCQNKITN